MKFGDKLRELREAKGLTRKALAEASGVPFGTIHGYEAGRRAPALGATMRLAKALGVTCEAFAECEDIAGDEDNEAPEPTPAKPAAAKTKGKKGKK